MIDGLTDIHYPSQRDGFEKMIRKEHSHRPRHMIQFVRWENVGTGALITYRLWNAFPDDPEHADEMRVAFCHSDGIIWDRSTRFVDPGAATADL